MKQTNNALKIVLIIIGILFMVFLVAKLWNNEDTWLCQDGQWVKHGNPTSSMPTETCR